MQKENFFLHMAELWRPGFKSSKVSLIPGNQPNGTK